MMGRTFKCKHCGRIVALNPRIKSGQRYCSLPGCQTARKNAWRRDKNIKDDRYRKKRCTSNKLWRKRHCAHLYQRQYRESHPDYILLNREKQQNRNDKRRDIHQSKKIVKSDSLHSERLIRAGLYELLPCRENNSGKIVKSDAFMVQLTVLQSNTAHLIQQIT